MYECVRLYENAYINACEIETLAMVEGHKPLFFFFKKEIQDRDFSHAERVTNHLFFGK